MNIIFDNIIFSLQKSGGGSVYWYEIISRFLNTDNNIICLEQNFENENFQSKELKLEHRKSVSKTPLFINRVLPILKCIKERTIVHSSYYRVSFSNKAINIITIHDFTPELYFRGISRLINFWRKKIAIMKADGIICISENTKKDLLYYHPKVNQNKIKVIYNGVGNSFFKINTDIKSELIDDEVRSVMNKKYVLYVGHRTNYKNFDVAVKTILNFTGDLHFVIVGEPLNSEESNFVNKYLQQKDYTVLSKKNTQTLNLLYNNAFCLLYPSSYEGFGIPVIEAMKTGCPVIATNKSSIPEVAGNAALLVEEINDLTFTEAICRLKNNDLREELIQRGFIQANKFSWDKSFEEVLNFYTTLYEVK
jgi:glycosyltransferase involved in cell wall biosynthesis